MINLRRKEVNVMIHHLLKQRRQENIRAAMKMNIVKMKKTQNPREVLRRNNQLQPRSQ